MNKLIFSIFLIATLAAGVDVHAETAPRTDWREVVAPGEPALFESIAHEINALQDRTAHDAGTPVDRAFHAKPHTVLKAELRVLDSLPEALRVGAFAKPTTYPAWV